MKVQEKTGAQPSSQPLEGNEFTTCLKPPAFQLMASAAGGDPKTDGMQHVGFEGTPLEAAVAGWPGEVVMIHSPCYSEEIEAIALAAEGKPEQYEPAATAIDALIEECKHRKFQNAEGLENNWAEGKLCGTVKM